MANELNPIGKIESIEIIPEKKIFRINGKDFGKRCTGFRLLVIKSGTDDFEVKINYDTAVTYTN